MSLFRSFMAANRRVCRAIDARIPPEYAVDGNRHFPAEVVPRFVRPGITVADVGGGKTPFFSVSDRQRLALTVIGVDESADELSRAPVGAYDETIVADICRVAPPVNADLTVCMTVIEHVASAEQAMASLYRMTKPGGTVAIFAPCRNTIYANLNLLLPEGLKRHILHAIIPESVHFAGFPATYDHCTPSALERVATAAGFRVVERRVYHWSGYFDFFVPLYLAWRAISIAAYQIVGDDAADRFYLILER